MSATDSAPSVDEENPWLGLASFTEQSRAYFFGREGEVAELERRVQRKLLTVLFGKSGLGKTSILQAGLVPGLRARGYFPVYLRIDYGHDSPEPAEQIKQAINHAAAGQSAAPGAPGQAALAIDPEESIWEFLHHRDEVRRDVSAETPLTPIPLLIFDQFEELFTLAQSDEFGRARAAKFVEELADLVENRPPKALEERLDTDESLAERFDFSRSDYRVVITLREDYLAPLESLKKQMPSLSQNRLRLAPMTGSQALEAVLLPGNRLRPGRPLVTEEVAEAIVRFVAGGSELANAEVEPSLLSLICRELNEQRIAQGRGEISQDLLAGSHATILSTFYERSLADQPESVRRIIEDDLLTESGYRENLAEESLLRRFQVAGAAPDALAKLVNRRLLRIEERLDVRRVELTHDVLTGVVKASRDQRHERETREATERMLAEQRERESAARRAVRRARTVAGGCTLLAAAAVVAAVLAFVNVQRARRAEADAKQTRVISEQARQQAEGLLGFLTDSFVRELETFGRSQTIAELSQREIDYFQHLPPQLEDPETLRSGALALLNHAGAAGQLGDVTTAGKDVAAAIALLESLRRTDQSGATAIVLGRAYTESMRLRWDESAGAEAAIPGRRAVQLLQPVAEQSRASVEARRAYLDALAFLGFVNAEVRHDEEAARIAREAQRVGKQLGLSDEGDLTVDANYAAAGMSLALALVHRGDDDEARQAAEDALAVADRVLAQRPQYGGVLVVKQISEGELADIASEEFDPSAALHFRTQEVQTSLELIGIEPGNFTYSNELGITYMGIGRLLWDEGQLHEGVDQYRKGMMTLGKIATAGGIPLGNWASSVAYMANAQALLGDSPGATATIAAADTFRSMDTLRNRGPTGSDLPVIIDAFLAYPATTVAYEHEEFAAARRIAGNALTALQTRFPPTAPSGPQDMALCNLAGMEGRADYELSAFDAAAQAESIALQACQAFPGFESGPVAAQRTTAQVSVWLSMALAREGKQKEATQTIGPVVTMYRALEKKNHGDQWLPLDLAEALYAQSLTDDRHRPVLLREAAQRVDHLIPAIAVLHDTRAWRARIEEAQRHAGH